MCICGFVQVLLYICVCLSVMYNHYKVNDVTSSEVLNLSDLSVLSDIETSGRTLITLHTKLFSFPLIFIWSCYISTEQVRMSGMAFGVFRTSASRCYVMSQHVVVRRQLHTRTMKCTMWEVLKLWAVFICFKVGHKLDFCNIADELKRIYRIRENTANW